MDIHSITMYQACLLHSRAERALKSMVSNQLNGWKITRMEWLVLATLAESSSSRQGLTMTAVADILDVTLPQLNALCVKLIARELVHLGISASDKRVKIISVTSKGKKMVNDIEISMRSDIKVWVADVNRDDLSCYMNTLHTLGGLNLSRRA